MCPAKYLNTFSSLLTPYIGVCTLITHIYVCYSPKHAASSINNVVPQQEKNEARYVSITGTQGYRTYGWAWKLDFFGPAAAVTGSAPGIRTGGQLPCYPSASSDKVYTARPVLFKGYRYHHYINGCSFGAAICVPKCARRMLLSKQ